MLKPNAAAWILIKIAYMVTNMIIFSCYVVGVLKIFFRGLKLPDPSNEPSPECQ